MRVTTPCSGEAQTSSVTGILVPRTEKFFGENDLPLEKSYVYYSE